MSAARVQRTYNIVLSQSGYRATVPVSLSYELDAEGNALDVKGKIIEPMGLPAQLEAINRLRRLAAKGKTFVTDTMIDDADWDIQLVRQRLLTS